MVNYAVGLMLFMVCSAVFGGNQSKSVSLKWKPSDDVQTKEFIDVGPLKKLKMSIGPVIDSRENKKEIGRNIEQSQVKFYYTDDDLAAWSENRIDTIFRFYKITLDTIKPDIIVAFDIVNFYCTEGSTYKGIVSLKVTAKSAGGSIIWEGVTSGESNRWGRSFSVSNYLECMCNAFVDSIYDLLKNTQFIKALAENRDSASSIHPNKSVDSEYRK